MARPNVTTRPVRRSDLEALRTIGIPFRVIDSIEQVINDVFEILPDSIEQISDQSTVDDQALALAQTANSTANNSRTDITNLQASLVNYIPIFGSGPPEGVVSANFSRMYVDVDPETPGLYVNESGQGFNAGWSLVNPAPEIEVIGGFSRSFNRSFNFRDVRPT